MSFNDCLSVKATLSGLTRSITLSPSALNDKGNYVATIEGTRNSTETELVVKGLLLQTSSKAQYKACRLLKVL